MDQVAVDFVEPKTGRHRLDALYERFAKPQLQINFATDEPSIYIRHDEGCPVSGGYQVERVFEDSKSGLYAEGRVALTGKNPPVLVIRGYGSWYPFERVLEDSPDVFIAEVERQLNASETVGAIAWLKYYTEHGKLPDVIGESLGGKVAQQIAVKYPNYYRSIVTYNALGVAEKFVKKSQANNVFHYFTRGERYAYWANRGDYIEGKFFLISKSGKRCQYKLEEKIINLSPNSRLFQSQSSKKRWQIIGLIAAQLILLKRHNELVLQQKKPIVVEIDKKALMLMFKSQE